MTEKTVFTEYAKVTESHLVQLEIHVLGEIEEDASWFNKQTHVKEITDVLMPVMQNRVTCLCERKTDKCPRKELTPLHVDGPSLRLAYSFKRRSPLHQCVLINCTERSLRSRCCRSLPVFSEKLVVHAYHLAGYYRLEAIAQNSEQTLLSYKFGVAIRSTSRTTASESTTSVYFDEDESCTQPHQRTLRNIIKKSGPKLSKSKRTQPVEQEDSVESLWTTLEDEDDLSKAIHGMSDCRVSSVTARSTMLVEDPLMTIEDSGFYQEERPVTDTNTFDEIRKSDGFSSISDSDESKNVENPKMLAHSKTKWNHCSEEEPDMSAVVANVECRQDKTPTKKHSMAESAAFQQKCRDKAAKLTTNSNNHTELSTQTNGSCVSDDNDIKEQCDKEEQPNSLGPLKPSQQDCILSDSEPMCHPRDGEKEQRKLRLKKTTKRATPLTSPASPDISGCDIRAVDSGSPAWKISRLADTQTMGTSTSLEKTAPKNRKQVEKPYRNCRSRNPTPNGDTVSLVSQHCADITVPSDTVKPKGTKNGVPSPSTRHEKKPKQLEKQYTNSRNCNSTSSGNTVSLVSEHCVDITQPSYTVPDGTKNGVTSPSTQRGNVKATKKAMPVVSTGKILRASKRMKLSKGKKMNNKLALLLKEMEAESPSSKDRVAAQGCGRTGFPLANKKTSDKLASILKEMEDDIHINSSDICNNSGTKVPSRARAALVSDSFVITEHNSLDKDPFREPTKMSWLEEPGVKTKKTKAGGQLSGDVTVQHNSKRRRLSDSDGCHSVSSFKLPLQGSKDGLPCNFTKKQLDSCHSVSPSKSPVLCSKKNLGKRSLSGSDDCNSVSPSKSPLQGPKDDSPCSLTKKKLSRPRLSDSDSCHSVSPSKSPLQGSRGDLPCRLTKNKLGRCSLSGSDSGQSVSPSKSPLQGSRGDLLYKLTKKKLGRCSLSGSHSCRSVSPSKSPLQGSRGDSPCKLTKKKLGRCSLSGSDSGQSVSPSKSSLQGSRGDSPCKLTKKKLGRCSLSGSDSGQSVSPSKSPLQGSRGGSPGKLTKVELGRPRTTPKSCVDEKRPGLALKDTNNIRQREFSMPQNVTKDRRQVNKLPKKTQSLSYRMNSDSDFFLMNRNDFPVASRRSSSVGRVNLYFRQAMQYETRSISQEKMGDKEDEDTENALIKDLLNDCFIDETKTKPPVVDTLPEQTSAEIAQIKNVCDLTEEQLIYIVKKNTQYLKDIFEGKEQCRRHNDYKEGGKTRIALNYQVRLNLYSEEQPDIIVSALVAIFCKKTGSKYLDYVLKVLLPEILIKIYMDMHGTSYPDTEEIMAQARPMQQDF